MHNDNYNYIAPASLFVYLLLLEWLLWVSLERKEWQVTQIIVSFFRTIASGIGHVYTYGNGFVSTTSPNDFEMSLFFFLFLLFDDLSFLNVKSEKFEKLFLCDGIDLIESTLGIDRVESTDSSISSMELFSLFSSS